MCVHCVHVSIPHDLGYMLYRRGAIVNYHIYSIRHSGYSVQVMRLLFVSHSHNVIMHASGCWQVQVIGGGWSCGWVQCMIFMCETVVLIFGILVSLHLLESLVRGNGIREFYLCSNVFKVNVLHYY